MKAKTLFFSSLVAAAAMSTVPAWADAETIQISYGSNNNETTTGGGTITYSDSWNKATNNSNSDTAASTPLKNSAGTETTATTTWTSKNTWYLSGTAATSADDVLKGYLDDGSEGSITGVTITVSNISYLVYDVTVIASTDTANKQYTAKTINGQTYTSNGDGNGILGNTTWGNTNTTTVVAGDNSFTVSGLYGDLSLSSTGSNTSNRGCVAGLIITNTGGTAVNATISANSTWTDSSLAGTAWTNATTDSRYLANITLSDNATLNVTGTVSTTAIIASGDSKTLTLSGNAVNLIGPGVVRTDSTTANIVINNTLNFASGGKISGNVTTGTSGLLHVSGGTLDVAASAAASLNVSIDSGATYKLSGVGTTAVSAKVSGAGTVAVVGGVSTFTGDADQSYITLNNVSDTSAFTGSVELRNVQVVVSGNNASSFANASKVVLNSAALHFNNTAATFSKDIEIGSGQNGYIRAYGNNKIASGAGATIAGNVSGAGTLTSSDDGDVTFTGTVDIGTYVANKSGGISVFSGDSTTIGTLTMNSGTTVNFTGTSTVGLAVSNDATLNLSGTNTFTNLRQGAGTINVSSGTTTATNLVLSHLNGAGTLNVNSSAVLLITGSSNSTAGSAGSFMIGNYKQTNTVNVNGVINLKAAGITTRDGNGDIYVKSGAEMNFNAGLTVADNGNDAGVIRLHLQDGGRINIGGTAGISNSNILTLDLAGGTIGSLVDSWSTSRSLTLSGGVTIDTTKMTFNETGTATSAGMGSAITLSGGVSITKTDDATGSLTVTGAGKLKLSGTVTNAGTIDFSGANIELANAISNTGTVTVNSSTVFVLADSLLGTDTDTKTYTLITNGDDSGSITGWDSSTLTTANFRQADGSTLYARATVDVSTAGVVKLSDAVWNLYWKGGSSGTWDTSTATNWGKESVDGADTAFGTGDNAVFNTNASVSVSSGITAGTVTVASGTTLTLINQQNLTADSINIESGATLDLGNLENSVNVSKKLTGTGTVVVAKTGNGKNHGQTINLGTEFAGTVNYSGNLNPKNATFGSNDATVNFTGVWFWSNGETGTIAQALKFFGTENKSNNGTLNLTGDISFDSGASFTVGGGTVNISGAITDGNFTQSNGTLNFSGTGTKNVDSLEQTGGTLTVFNGPLNFTGKGTVSVSGAVSMRDNATVTQKGGTATFSRLLIHTYYTQNSSETYNLDGGVLNITGGSKGAATATGSDMEDSAGIIVGHWGSGTLSTLNVASGAVLNAVNGWTLLSWDTSSAFTINGEANLYGLSFTKTTSKNPTATLTLADGGRLNLGAGGIANESARATATNKVVLNGGTLGALDSWSATVAMAVNGNVTIDTTKMSANIEGNAKTTSEGATIALEGALSGIGGLMKSGAGTLKLSGANTFSGGVTVEKGTLEAGSANALGTGTLTVRGDGSVKATTSGVTLNNVYLFANNSEQVTGDGGTFTVADGATLKIDISALDATATADTETNVNQILLKIASANIISGETFFGTIAVGTTDDDGTWVASEQWKYQEGSWDATAGTLNLMTVPEPSTFGLLAGVGALVLVVARRRRRAK